MSPRRRSIPGEVDEGEAADDIAGFIAGDETDEEDAPEDVPAGEPEAGPAPGLDLPFTAIDWTAHAGDADGKLGAEVIQTLVKRLPNAPGVYRMMNAAGGSRGTGRQHRRPTGLEADAALFFLYAVQIRAVDGNANHGAGAGSRYQGQCDRSRPDIGQRAAGCV